MSSSKKLTVASYEASLEQVMGSNEGQLVQLSDKGLTIGRSEDNDLVTPSGAVSRYHAVIQPSLEGSFVIKDMGSKNGVQINGETVLEAYLQEGDLIQIGDHAFRFHEHSRDIPPDNLNKGFESEALSFGLPVKKSNKANPRIIIYVVMLVVGGYFLMQGDSENSQAKQSKKDSTQSEKSLTPPSYEFNSKGDAVAALGDPALTDAERQVEAIDWNNPSLREAEKAFREGRREFLNKNYLRAINRFQSSLNLNRQHPLADFYLRLSYYELETLALKHREIALKYFESLQYDRAVYHFNEVINLMQGRGGENAETRISEARRYILSAEQRIRAAELYP